MTTPLSSHATYTGELPRLLVEKHGVHPPPHTHLNKIKEAYTRARKRASTAVTAALNPEVQPKWL